MMRATSRLRTLLRSLPQTFISFSSSSSCSASPSPPRPPPALRNSFPSPTSLHFSPFSSRRRKGGEDREEEEEDEGGGSVFVLGRDPESPPQLFVVQPRLRPDSLLNSKLSEALNLANSLEEQRDGLFTEDFSAKQLPPHLVVQNPAARSVRAHADTYFGPGTVENVKCHLKALESENGIDAVFVNAVLSGIQQRNLEVAWGKPVLDRVGLIIEIFNAHAETKEAKLQSELAALMYKRTRLVRIRGASGRLTFGASGEAEVVSARGRGSGGRGFISGAGETELQLQRRRIQERRNRLLAQIEEVRRTRALQRSARKRHGDSQGHGLATVAVVGYTNAGKSTLVSALSQTDLFSDDRLFATVDPRLRSVILPSGRKTLLSDTVGFISDLPVQLVEAFHATLEEVVEADLLVHVLDSSAPNLVEQRSTVLQVLQQIGVSEEKIQNMIEVWNKIDLLKKDKEAYEILDQDECPDEGEGERNGKFSEADDVMASELLSIEPLDDDDGMASGMSSGELADKDDSDVVDSELSSEECLVTVDQQAELSGDRETTDPVAPSEPNGAHVVQHVETSAVMGIGLAELLSLIDEKLSAPKSFEEKRLGPFDRKWRPSYTEDIEKAAEQ